MERKKREHLRKSLAKMHEEMKQQVRMHMVTFEVVLLPKQSLNFFAGRILSRE